MRRFIRNSPLLYPLYVKYVLRNRTTVFPGPTTDLHLTGFPRSANTYCFNIIKAGFESLRISTHIHTTASLKLARRYGTPTMVLVRDPVSTCCSLLVKLTHEPTPAVLEAQFRDYLEYHEYVLAHRADIDILKFEDVVQSPTVIVTAVAERLGIKLSDAQIQDKATAGQRLVESKEENKAVEGSSLPNEERRALKKKIEAQVTAHPQCATAMACYSALVSRSD
ncbi:MAG: hypothetical protein AB8G17_14365 [Gammaproteobacteria bacterium]